jgi:thiol-disulfide isomerase/thioredoxin
MQGAMKQLFTLLLCATCHLAVAQPFTVSPSPAVAGETVTITYAPRLTPLADSKQVTAVIYLCDGDAWRADDLEMTPGDTAWVATYRLPEDVVLLACKFHGDDGAWDSGTRWSHYGHFVLARDGDALVHRQGAYLHWGLLRYQPLEQHAVPGYSRPGECIEDNVMYLWIRNEYRYFPASRETLSFFAANSLEKIEPGTHADSYLQDVDYILSLPAPAERSLLRAAGTCRALLKDEARAREIEALVLQRFPDGELAREREGLRIHLMKDLDEKERAVIAFMKRFPPGKFPRVNDHYTRQIVMAALQHRATRRGDHDLLFEYLPVVHASVLPEFYYRLVQLPKQHGLKTLDELLPLSTAIHDEMTLRATRADERLHDPLHVYSPREWASECLRRHAGFFFTHADLLHEAGRHAEAMEILEPLKERYAKGSTFNDLYARLLAANGYHQMVIPFIEAAARVDATTPAMLETLREGFSRANPAGDFDAYLATLRSPDFVEQFEERLKGSLIKKELKPFALEDTRGQRVDMANLKGKVIVLDFWSTWCSPCKAALPGMQVAVDRYKDNPGVAFYFISTLEYDPNYKTVVRDFIASKNYSLEVLYDNTDPATGKHGALYHEYAKPLGMNGIPHKAIIDADGFLRWSSGGYYGNPLELANEITFLVNYLLAEKKKRERERVEKENEKE